MDAVKYLKEKQRMCEKYIDCLGCPIYELKSKHHITCVMTEKTYPEEAVEIVEKWSAEHPEKPMWKQVNEEYAGYRCTNCGAISPYNVRGLSYTPKFCHECGSEMHGVIELKEEIPWNDCRKCKNHDSCNWEDRMDRCYDLRDGKGDCFTMKG